MQIWKIVLIFLLKDNYFFLRGLKNVRRKMLRVGSELVHLRFIKIFKPTVDVPRTLMSLSKLIVQCNVYTLRSRISFDKIQRNFIILLSRFSRSFKLLFFFIFFFCISKQSVMQSILVEFLSVRDFRHFDLSL